MNLKYYFKKLELIPVNELHKDKIVTKCFLHNEVNGKSLVIDFKRNKWKCYGKCCKSGSITDLLIKFGFNELIQFNNKEEIIEQQKPINIIPFNKVEYRFKINKQLYSYYESRNLDIDFTQRALVQSMNEVAHAMGKKTIAEYVENEKIWMILNEMQIDYGQGYYLGKPTKI